MESYSNIASQKPRTDSEQEESNFETGGKVRCCASNVGVPGRLVVAPGQRPFTAALAVQARWTACPLHSGRSRDWGTESGSLLTSPAHIHWYHPPLSYPSLPSAPARPHSLDSRATCPIMLQFAVVRTAATFALKPDGPTCRANRGLELRWLAICQWMPGQCDSGSELRVPWWHPLQAYLHNFLRRAAGRRPQLLRVCTLRQQQARAPVAAWAGRGGQQRLQGSLYAIASCTP